MDTVLKAVIYRFSTSKPINWAKHAKYNTYIQHFEQLEKVLKIFIDLLNITLNLPFIIFCYRNDNKLCILLNNTKKFTIQ